jgi:hypothetical protein
VIKNVELAAQHLAECRQKLKDQFKKVAEERKAQESAAWNDRRTIEIITPGKISAAPAAENGIAEKRTLDLTKFQLTRQLSKVFLV